MGSFNIVRVVVLITVIAIVCSTRNGTRPNVVFIIADDMGWDDVSFHGSDQVLTPNIDLLAYTGVALERHYTHCVCTPSRAAFLTGKYAHTIGMHGYPLTNGEDRGLPLTEKLLPEYLKELGYATHLVGKWHLGQSRTEYLPTSRGFDSHFGYRGGYIDYYEYLNEESWIQGIVAGMDMYRNLTPAWDVKGYITDVFTEESTRIIKAHDKSTPLFLMVTHLAPHGGNDGALLQAPPEVVRSMRHVELMERRIYTAMMKKLDDSVGDIITALEEKEILDNTIVVLISDNGGMPFGISVNYASNWPMRGTKFSPYEGGVRTAGLVWTSSMTNINHLWKGYIHIVDWLPTLLKAIGATSPSDIDGLDLWDNIVNNQVSKRNDIVEIFTYPETGFKSITSGNYKIILGNVTREYNEHFGGDFRGIIGVGPSYTESIKGSQIYAMFDRIRKPFNIVDLQLRNNMKVNCGLRNISKDLCYPDNGKICLYNINEDPCETKNISADHPDIVQSLLQRLELEACRTIDRPQLLFRDPRALPSLHNFTWSVWANDIPKC